MKTIFLLPTLILTVLVVTCCSSRSRDRELTRIAETVSNQPEEALKSLKAIDTLTLSEAQRHYYDFLTVKANDKAYITHTSDSLILRVIDYYSRHNRELYPEALYYGGRVYDDLGEKPLALRYFQDALEAMPEDTKDIDLKCRIQSQTARLLISQRLYTPAIPYLEQTIKVSKQQGDTINIVFDLQLLGYLYNNTKDYTKVKQILKEALYLGGNLPKGIQADTKIDLARAYFESGSTDSALLFIRAGLSESDSMARNVALTNAIKIYRKIGFVDTAFMYANELIHSPDGLNRAVGYSEILSPELRKYVPSDSLDNYYDNYIKLLNSYYNHNESQMIINQHNSYNYNRQEKQKIKAEKDRDKYKFSFYGALALIVIIVFSLILYYTIRKKNRIIILQQILVNVVRTATPPTNNVIDSSLEERQFPSNRMIGYDNPTESANRYKPLPSCYQSAESVKLNEKQVREFVIKELLTLAENYNYDVPISTEIMNSEIYVELKDLVEEEKIIKKDMWDKVEELVLKASPYFIKRLQILTRGKISKVEMEVALLVKVGMRPVDIQHLIGKSHSTVGSRKETLSVKIFGKKTSQKVTNAIIRLL